MTLRLQLEELEDGLGGVLERSDPDAQRERLDGTPRGLDRHHELAFIEQGRESSGLFHGFDRTEAEPVRLRDAGDCTGGSGRDAGVPPLGRRRWPSGLGGDALSDRRRR